MTWLYIIYENGGKEKEIAKYKRMNKQKLWLAFILYMKMKERKGKERKEIYNYEKTNKPIDWLYTSYYIWKWRKEKKK